MKNVKDQLFNMTRAWNKEHMAGALSTELRELMESKVI